MFVVNVSFPFRCLKDSQGMWAVNERSVPTGETTLNRQMHSFGWSTLVIDCVWVTARKSCTAYFSKTYVPSYCSGKPCAVQLSFQRLAGASLLVFANKQDIQGSMTDKEIEQALNLPAIKSHQWSIIPCSAITGYNLLEGLNWVVREVAGRLYYSSFPEGVAGVLDRPPVVS